MPWSPPRGASHRWLLHAVGSGDRDEDERRPSRLGEALTARTLEFEEPRCISLPLAANVLRPIGDETVRVRDLPRRACAPRGATASASIDCPGSRGR